MDAEDEFLGQRESEDRRDEDEARGSEEPELISKGDPLYLKGSLESKEKVGQTSSIKSDVERASEELASPAITDKCQDTKDLSNTYVEVPPVNDSCTTELDEVLESQFSRENEGLGNKKREGEQHVEKDQERR